MSDPNVYATRSDLYDYGFLRGNVSNPGRLCASVLAATDTFELDGHGLSLNTPIITRAEPGGTLPAPLVAGATVYAIPVNDQTFKVAATAGGPAIDLTTDGDQVIVATPLPVDKVLAYWSRIVDSALPAHAVPFDPPYPDMVVATVAKLAAAELQIMAGQSSLSLTEVRAEQMALLQQWAKGGTIRDSRAGAATDVAYSESVDVDPRGWGRRCARETIP